MYLHLKRTSLLFLQGVELLSRVASAESASADCQSKPLDPSPAHSLHPARTQLNYTAHFICIYVLDRCCLKAIYKMEYKIPAILVCLFSGYLFVCEAGSGSCTLLSLAEGLRVVVKGCGASGAILRTSCISEVSA